MTQEHKTFEDETFEIEKIDVEFNSLTDRDPYVDRIELVPKSENIEVIGYSANKKVYEKGEKKDPISGIKFEGKVEKTKDKRFSEVPEVLKKIQAKLNNDEEVVVTTNIGRYSSENTTSFYLTDTMLENMEVHDLEDDDEDTEVEDEDAEPEEEDGEEVEDVLFGEDEDGDEDE